MTVKSVHVVVVIERNCSKTTSSFFIRDKRCCVWWCFKMKNRNFKKQSDRVLFPHSLLPSLLLILKILSEDDDGDREIEEREMMMMRNGIWRQQRMDCLILFLPLFLILFRSLLSLSRKKGLKYEDEMYPLVITQEKYWEWKLLEIDQDGEWMNCKWQGRKKSKRRRRKSLFLRKRWRSKREIELEETRSYLNYYLYTIQSQITI